MSENSDCDVTPTSGCDTTGAGCDTAGTGYMSPQPCGRGGANGSSPNPSAGGAVSPGALPPLGKLSFAIQLLDVDKVR